MSKSALDTLTAQYTDSENEANYSHSDSPCSQSSQAIIVHPISRPPTPPLSEPPKKKLKKKKSKKSVRRLVSYQDDLIVTDEENQVSSSSSEETEESEDDSETEVSKELDDKSNLKNKGIEDVDTENGKENSEDIPEPEKAEKYAHYGFSLPSEPKSKPSPELVDKIRGLYEKMKTQNMDLNRIIQERKEFRNPSIYEKLIQFCDINELGTNYPPEIYDPLRWGPESYYEELARVQKDEMVRRQKKRKENDKIEQATALARKVEKEAKKRKSKWDQPGPVAAPAAMPSTLTNRFTGTKGTVISAFGSLPKKPAM